jgi:hypothetical protein
MQPGCHCEECVRISEVVENKSLLEDGPEVRRRDRGAKSPANWMIANTLTTCLSGTKATSVDEERARGERLLSPAWGHAGLRAVLLWNVLRTRSRGAVEIAFDDENGYVIIEVIAAKIRSGVIDTGHEILGGQ